MNQYQVVSIPTDDDKVSSALGISNLRNKEIHRHLDEVDEDKEIKSTSVGLEAATSIAENINETAYICFVYGCQMERTARMHGIAMAFHRMFSDNDD